MFDVCLKYIFCMTLAMNLNNMQLCIVHKVIIFGKGTFVLVCFNVRGVALDHITTHIAPGDASSLCVVVFVF